VPPLKLNKLSPVLVVDRVEPCLAFWTDRLGFAQTVDVPEGDGLGFVILARDGVEVMYQSRESVRKDIPALAAAPSGGANLYIEVSDIAAIERAVKGVEIVVPRRKTFYGADEIGVREPGGNLVVFGQHGS
jgi:catechol 2,3-dioxygenase-like lactoylglutathione lyase family enzyme